MPIYPDPIYSGGGGFADHFPALALGTTAVFFAAIALRLLLGVNASVRQTASTAINPRQLARKMAGCAALGILASGLAAAGGWILFDWFWSTLKEIITSKVEVR